MLHQALAAAADTLNEQKVAALARSLANGLRDDAALVDEEMLIVRALADLDNVHVKLLAAVAKERRESESWLQNHVGLSSETFGAVVAGLERNHLVVDDTDLAGQFNHELSPKPGSELAGATAWKITAFGLLAMKRLDPTTT